jgi:hypothetical protein
VSGPNQCLRNCTGHPPTHLQTSIQVSLATTARDQHPRLAQLDTPERGWECPARSPSELSGSGPGSRPGVRARRPGPSRVLDRVQVALLRARVDDGVVGRQVQRHASNLEMHGTIDLCQHLAYLSMCLLQRCLFHVVCSFQRQRIVVFEHPSFCRRTLELRRRAGVVDSIVGGRGSRFVAGKKAHA